MKKKTKHILLYILIGLIVVALGLMIGFAIWKKAFTIISIIPLMFAILITVFLVLLLVLNRNVEIPNQENNTVEVKEMTAICPNCGTENKGDAPYCKKCGHWLK